MHIRHTSKVLPDIRVYKTKELYEAPPGRYCLYYGHDDVLDHTFMTVRKTGVVYWLDGSERMADDCWTVSRWEGPYPL